MLPYALQAIRSARQYHHLRWLMGLSPFYLGAAITVTVSRGAQIGYLIACGFAIFLMLPRLRLPILTCAVIGGAVLFSARDLILESLGKMAGENQEESRIIMIDGEEVEYTGTKHRWLLLQVYRAPLQQAGWFGWGGSLKGIQIDPELENRFGSIDSHYILFYLQYGRVGSALFITVMVTVILSMISVAWYDSPWRPFAAGIAAAFLAIAISMSSVWFAPDYGAIWLFIAGLSANLKTLWMQNDVALEGPLQEVEHVVHRRLIPVSQLSWSR